MYIPINWGLISKRERDNNRIQFWNFLSFVRSWNCHGIRARFKAVLILDIFQSFKGIGIERISLSRATNRSRIYFQEISSDTFQRHLLPTSTTSCWWPTLDQSDQLQESPIHGRLIFLRILVIFPEFFRDSRLVFYSFSRFSKHLYCFHQDRLESWILSRISSNLVH